MSELSTKALEELFENPELVESVIEPCACGAPRALSLGLNAIVCTDTGCPFRVAARLYAILEKYQLASKVTLTELEDLCQDRYYRSWVDFFTDDLEDTEYEELYHNLVKAIQSGIDVPTMVMFAGVDCLSNDQIYNLCGDFQSVSDLATVLDEDGVLFISERFGLTEAHLLPVAIHIFNDLTTHITEMLEAEDILGTGEA